MEQLIAKGELFCAEVVRQDYGFSKKKFNNLLKKYNKSFDR